MVYGSSDSKDEEIIIQVSKGGKLSILKEIDTSKLRIDTMATNIQMQQLEQRLLAIEKAKELDTPAPRNKQANSAGTIK